VKSSGVTGNQSVGHIMNSLSVLGLGLMHQRKVHGFHDDLHAYLAACGLKANMQNIIETLGAGHRARPRLRAFPSLDICPPGRKM
jgi:raffinose synthase